MRKFFFLLMLIPILGISQTKNVGHAFRVFPKPDKIAEFEKAFTAHAQNIIPATGSGGYLKFRAARMQAAFTLLKDRLPGNNLMVAAILVLNTRQTGTKMCRRLLPVKEHKVIRLSTKN